MNKKFEQLTDEEKIQVLEDLIEDVEREVYYIEDACQHYIPYYAYGDNEAAVEMSVRLSEVFTRCQDIHKELLERTQ